MTWRCKTSDYYNEPPFRPTDVKLVITPMIHHIGIYWIQISLWIASKQKTIQSAFYWTWNITIMWAAAVTQQHLSSHWWTFLIYLLIQSLNATKISMKPDWKQEHKYKPFVYFCLSLWCIILLINFCPSAGQHKISLCWSSWKGSLVVGYFWVDLFLRIHSNVKIFVQ